MQKILYILLFVFLASCQQNSNTSQVNKTEALGDSVIQNKNVKTIFSTNINQLDKLLDFSTFKPVKVKYKYTFINNSGSEKRIAVPGPSDAYLEAVLYFDNKTFNQLLKEYTLVSTITTGKKHDYEFDWLDSNIKTELANIDSSQNDHTSFIFLKNNLPNSGCFLLNDKVLIRIAYF